MLWRFFRRMNKVQETEARVKCRYCAEMIMPEALICPFCRSKLSSGAGSDKPADSVEPPAAPGFMRVMVYNLICPGFGAWKLGHRARGAVIFFLVIGCLTIFAGQVLPVIQRSVAVAVNTGRTQQLNALSSELENNPWLEIGFYAYLLSFVDSYFLMANARKKATTKV